MLSFDVNLCLFINFYPQSNANRSLWDAFVEACTGSSNGSVAGTLPTAATCFNMLKLPQYPSYDALLDKLKQAIANDVGFGLA